MGSPASVTMLISRGSARSALSAKLRAPNARAGIHATHGAARREHWERSDKAARLRRRRAVRCWLPCFGGERIAGIATPFAGSVRPAIGKLRVAQPVAEGIERRAFEVAVGAALHRVIFERRQLVDALVESYRQPARGIVAAGKRLRDRRRRPLRRDTTRRESRWRVALAQFTARALPLVSTTTSGLPVAATASSRSSSGLGNSRLVRSPPLKPGSSPASPRLRVRW